MDNKLTRVEITTIGFYSFKTKRIYKTMRGLKIAEKKHENSLKETYQTILNKVSKTIEAYKQYARELKKQIPSFLRWSNILACIQAIREEIRSTPKAIRYKLSSLIF